MAVTGFIKKNQIEFVLGLERGARAIGVSRSTIYQWKRRGILNPRIFERLGGRWRVNVTLIKQGENPTNVEPRTRADSE